MTHIPKTLTDAEKAENLIAFGKALEESADRKPMLQRATDNQIADALLHFVWAELDAFSLESDLVQQAIDRLRTQLKEDI